MVEKPGQNDSRKAAWHALNRVCSGAYADIVLATELETLPQRERPLATELTFGVLRNYLRLDRTIDSFSAIKTKKMETGVLNALRLGAYQILFLSGVPARAAVNESVALVRNAGKKKSGFVNAVLRKIAEAGEPALPAIEDDPLAHITNSYSHPQWLVNRWIDRYGATEAAELCKANSETPPKTIRTNTLVNSRAELMERLAEEGVEARETAYSPDGLKIINGQIDPADRRYYIQDEASQIVARIVNPAPGSSVLDACAAPGGKTTHMAQIMENKGLIVAVDKYPGRLRTVSELSKRLGTTIIRTLEADSSGILKMEGIREFDYILLDAPCTGLGVLRRAPDIKLRIKERDIAERAELQARLLSNAGRYLKKGGHMVYSVCSFEPEETDNVVNGFISSKKGFAVEDLRVHAPGQYRALIDKAGFFRALPHRHGMDGFFAARLKKTA